MSCSIRISVISRSSASSSSVSNHALATREARGRLVEHHQLRLAGPRHGHLQLPLLAVRERRDGRVQRVLQPDPLGELAGPFPHRAVAAAQPHRAEVTAAHAEHRQVEVVLDAQAEEEPRRLEGAGQAHAAPASAPGRCGHVLAEELHRARSRRELAGDEVEERRLARAVRAEDRAPLAGEDLQVDVGARRWTPPKRRPIPRRRRIGAAPGASTALDAVAAAAISVRRSARSASSALLRPRRRIRLLALRVRPVGRRRVGAEVAAERLVDLRDRLDRLHVGDAVAVVVRRRSAGGSCP